jgi:penicillin-binding protein 1C
MPRNYNGTYMGNVTLRTALANSLNVPAVEMTQLVGTDKVLETAKKLGVESIDESRYYGLSLGLGSAELAGGCGRRDKIKSLISSLFVCQAS